MWRKLVNELRVSARALLRTPRFLTVTLVTLALGIEREDRLIWATVLGKLRRRAS
mgnify:CR=1 FL=1